MTTDAPTTAAEMREAAEPWRAVTFRYTNWRGETAIRRAVPAEIFWSATEHHPEPQWIMRAFDLDKDEPRDFALKDCAFAAASAVEAEMVERVARAIAKDEDPSCDDAFLDTIMCEPDFVNEAAERMRFRTAAGRLRRRARAAIAAMKGE